jgi:hypothetical protein
VQELVTEADPSFLNYGNLALLRYSDLDLKRGDAAFEKAEAKATPDTKSALKQLEQIRAQAVKSKKQLAKAPDEPAPGEAPLSDPFGGGLGAPAAP